MARTLGIDIDDHAVRGAVLRTAFRRTEVERYLQIPLAALPATPARLPEVHEALQSLLRAMGKPPDTTVTALDGTQASLRVVELPSAASKRVADVLPFELESMLPFDIADAVIDYQVVGTQDGRLKLLAAAAPRERMRAHLALFQGTALDPREVAVGAAALEGLRHVCPELADKPVALLELCAGEANLCMLDRGHTTFARTISVGWDGNPKNEAELWQSVHRTLAAYRASGGPPLDTLYVCGIGPLAELAPWLARELSLPVETLTLPTAVGSATSADENTLGFSRALALAARTTASGKRINLRTGEFASTRTRTELTGHLSLVAVCAVAVLVALTIMFKAEQSVLRDEQQALRKSLRESTQAIFGKPESDPEAVDKLLAGPQSESPLPRFDAYDALAAISAAVPTEITHEMRHMRIDLADEKKEGQLELQGGLASIDQRDQIVAKLEAHGCFSEIEQGKTSPGRSADQINYQIEAKVRCPGEGAPTKKRKTEELADE